MVGLRKTSDSVLLLLAGMIWFLWMCPTGLGKKMTINKYIRPASGTTGVDLATCAHDARDSSYIGFRIPFSNDRCEPVTNADFYTSGEETGYQYLLKKGFHESATTPDNLAPNPDGDYVIIPGVLTSGASVEFTYTKTDTVGYHIDFMDESWQILIMTFRVMEPAVSVVMNSIDYGTSVWDPQVTCAGFPFTPFQEYSLKFFFTAVAIEVYVNGGLYHVFPHRYPFAMLRRVRPLMLPHSVTSGIHVSDVRVVFP